MAFAVSTVLLMVVYFFNFGMMNTGRVSGEKFDLNQIMETALNSITADLRNAYAFTEFRPNHIVMQRLPGSPITGEELAAIGSLQLHAVEYELVQEKDGPTILWRREPGTVGSKDQRIALLDSAKPELFTGYVYDRPAEKDDPVPSFHIFNTSVQTSGDLPRITLVRLNFDFRVGKTTMQMVSKVFLPIAHNNTVQGDWNVE